MQMRLMRRRSQKLLLSTAKRNKTKTFLEKRKMLIKILVFCAISGHDSHECPAVSTHLRAEERLHKTKAPEKIKNKKQKNKNKKLKLRVAPNFCVAFARFSIQLSTRLFFPMANSNTFFFGGEGGLQREKKQQVKRPRR